MTLPTTMNAVVLTGHGGMDKLEFRTDWPVPTPGPDDVLVKVGACGMNNTDVNTRSGWYSKEVTGATTGDAEVCDDADDPSWGGGAIQFPRIQGADTVGEVVAVGANASPDLIGKRVIGDCWLRNWDDPTNRDETGYFGSERDGGFAQYCTMDRRNANVIDSPLTDAELATFSCSYSTAEGMISRVDVGANDIILITGASGGVGSALVQLAKRRGATVVALASESKQQAVLELGADIVLPRTPENLAEALQTSIGRPTVTVVADIVGGNGFEAIIDVLARGGRYVCSGAIAGPIVNLDLRTLYLRDLTFHGSTVLMPDVFPRLVKIIESGDIRPVLAASYPLSEFHAAQKAFIEKTHTGNFVVVP